MFEEAERQLKRAIEGIFGTKLPMTIGIPDADWKKQYGYPMGAVMIDNVKIVDWIEDGCPESEKTEGDKVTLDFAQAEAEMIFSFHLASPKKVELDQLTLQFLAGISKMFYIGQEQEYRVGQISFRDVLPGPEEERVFERIFSIPLSGTICERVITERGTVEYEGEVSVSPKVLDQGGS